MDQDLLDKFIEIKNAIQNKDLSLLTPEEQCKYNTLLIALDEVVSKITPIGCNAALIAELNKYPVDANIVFSKGDSALYNIDSRNIKYDGNRITITI